MNEEKTKIVYTYNNAWNVEKRIYSIGDLRLPRALALDTLGFVLIGLILAVIIARIPVIGNMPPMFLYGGCLVGFPMLMKKARIHSKTPVRFLIGIVLFLFQPRSLTRFQPVKPVNAIRFTNVNFRR